MTGEEVKMEVKNDKLDMKKCIILILIGVFSYWGLNNFNSCY